IESKKERRFERVPQIRAPVQNAVHNRDASALTRRRRRRSSPNVRGAISPARRCGSRGSRRSSCGASSWEGRSCNKYHANICSYPVPAASSAAAVRVRARTATRELEHHALARQLLAVQVVDRVVRVARRDDVAQLAVAAEEVLHVALRRARRQTANVHAVGHRERSVKSSCLKVARFRNENTAKYEEKHASKFE
ncbi:hypothetical protein PRIPAC_71964, partial [Pristionchus pacificus]|uniref:Uncharacterized protein n=1 Tax=Pristionchus pacificus TaxID=54126 RepID=A0A2A6C5X2_PRIPA